MKHQTINLASLDRAIAAGRLPADARDRVLAAAVEKTATHARTPTTAWRSIRTPKRSTLMQQVMTATAKAGSVAKSIAKTSAGKDVTSPQTQAHRLAICATCPAVIVKRGKPHSCGRLRDALKPGAKTCGCKIALKIKDAKQKCPQGKW